jgi:NAD(P)H-flavin reductase
MKQQHTSSYRWVISKNKDLLFLIGGCSMSFLLLFADQLIRRVYPHVTHRMPTIIFWVWSYFIDAPHIYGTIVRTYCDKQEWQTRPYTLLFGVLWYFLGAFVSLFSYYINSFVPLISYNILLAFWSYWHVTRQHYGMLIIYKYKNNDFDVTIDNILDSMVLYLGLLLPYFSFIINSKLIRRMFQLNSSIGYWSLMSSRVCWTLYILIITVYTLRQIYMYTRHRSINIPKLLFLIACLSVSLSVLNPWISMYFDFITVIPIIVSFHDIQYHALLDFYCKNRYHSSGRDPSWFGPASFLSKYFILYYIGGIIIAYAFRILTCNSGPWGYRPQFCDNSVFWSRSFPLRPSRKQQPQQALDMMRFLRHVVDGIVTSASVHHYWLDGIIWKTRHNHELLKNLNIDSIKQIGNEKYVEPDTGISHDIALVSNEYRPLKLKEKISISEQVFIYRFALPSECDHSGLYDGQYVAVRAKLFNGTKQDERFYSPVSSNKQYGILDLLVKQEPEQQGTQGSMATHIDSLVVGNDSLEICGPCGGFDEDVTNYDHVAFICKGTGIAPCIQILRGSLDKSTSTQFYMIYSNTNQEDILFREELEQLATNHKNFKLLHVLSEETDVCETRTSNNVSYAVGHIQLNTIHRHFTFPHTSIRNKVIVCCPPVMSKPILSILTQAEFPQDCVYNYL